MTVASFDGERRLLRELESRIDFELSRVGILYRLFGRVKTERSMMEKVERKNYQKSGRKISDLIGVRIALYFADDVTFVDRALDGMFRRVETTRDEQGATVFGPTRFNITCAIPEDQRDQCQWLKTDMVSPTFEIQVRSVLSEGWHEVEHDLRYKVRGDWEGHGGLDRALNGILASIETSDWGIIKVFDELASSSYRLGRVTAMFRAKMRLRFISTDFSTAVATVLEQRRSLRKAIFRLPRERVVGTLLRSRLEVPLTMDNVVFMANRLAGAAPELLNLEPAVLSMAFGRLEEWGSR